MTTAQHDRGAGTGTATSDEALAGDAARGFEEQAQSVSLYFPTTQRAGQALRVVEGEAKAAQYLACLQTMQADPDELALIVAMLYGATLRGFCRVIEQALGGHHA